MDSIVVMLLRIFSFVNIFWCTYVMLGSAFSDLIDAEKYADVVLLLIDASYGSGPVIRNIVKLDQAED
ncbi:hypothetical protein MKW92_006372 [Papaver armeniacum]|nr:hypothetical protein MKW92_006372 [Papaver armeniacum]